MKEKDLDEVIAIEKVSFPSPWTRNMFLQELKDSCLSYFLVARIDKCVVGYGGFSLILEEAHIGNLAVHPGFRRMRIGEKLLTVMLDRAKSQGIKRVALEVRAGNLPAQNLYRKFAFRVTGRQRKYYQDTGEDALIMFLEL